MAELAVGEGCADLAWQWHCWHLHFFTCTPPYCLRTFNFFLLCIYHNLIYLSLIYLIYLSLIYMLCICPDFSISISSSHHLITHLTSSLLFACDGRRTLARFRTTLFWWTMEPQAVASQAEHFQTAWRQWSFDSNPNKRTIPYHAGVGLVRRQADVTERILDRCVAEGFACWRIADGRHPPNFKTHYCSSTNSVLKSTGNMRLILRALRVISCRHGGGCNTVAAAAGVA